MRRLILRGNECFEVDEECLRKKKMQGEECMNCKKNEKEKTIAGMTGKREEDSIIKRRPK